MCHIDLGAKLFLTATVATSVTEFGRPVEHFLLLALAVAILGSTAQHLAETGAPCGCWRPRSPNRRSQSPQLAALGLFVALGITTARRFRDQTGLTASAAHGGADPRSN